MKTILIMLMLLASVSLSAQSSLEFVANNRIVNFATSKVALVAKGPTISEGIVMRNAERVTAIYNNPSLLPMSFIERIFIEPGVVLWDSSRVDKPIKGTFPYLKRKGAITEHRCSAFFNPQNGTFTVVTISDAEKTYERWDTTSILLFFSFIGLAITAICLFIYQIVQYSRLELKKIDHYPDCFTISVILVIVGIAIAIASLGEFFERGPYLFGLAGLLIISALKRGAISLVVKTFK